MIPSAVHCMRGCDVYVGRKSSAAKVPNVATLTGGYPLGHFGSPVVLGAECPVCRRTHTRDGDGLAALDCYSSWCWSRIRREPEWAHAVRSLRRKRLGCWCSSKACHGDVLALASEVLAWGDGVVDVWEERAAIMAEGCGIGRYEAERAAYAAMMAPV